MWFIDVTDSQSQIVVQRNEIGVTTVWQSEAAHSEHASTSESINSSKLITLSIVWCIETWIYANYFDDFPSIARPTNLQHADLNGIQSINVICPALFVQ